MQEITCREFIEFLMSYLEMDLPEPERGEFDRHLAACPTCVAYMKTYQQAVRLGKQAFLDPGAPVPTDVPEELVAAILSARRRAS